MHQHGGRTAPPLHTLSARLRLTLDPAHAPCYHAQATSSNAAGVEAKLLAAGGQVAQFYRYPGLSASKAATLLRKVRSCMRMAPPCPFSFCFVMCLPELGGGD